MLVFSFLGSQYKFYYNLNTEKLHVLLTESLMYVILVFVKKKLKYIVVPLADSVMSELTNEARQCLSAHSGRDGIAPWTGVNYW